MASTSVVLALAVCLAGAGCSPPDSEAGAPDVTVSCRVLRPQPGQSKARVELLLVDAAGGGCYTADLQSAMGGDWYLLVEATLVDGRTLQRRIDVPGVRSP